MASQEGSASPAPMRIRESSCTFEFEIDHFKSKDLPVGKCISSPTFNAGGYDWSLDFYPRGDDAENESSIFFNLESEAHDISGKISLELLSKEGKHTIVEDYSTFSGPSFLGVSLGTYKLEDFCFENGILVFSCNISIGKHKVVEDSSGGLCEHIENLWNMGKRFDVTFEVEGKSISAHRLILAARSPVFEAMFFGPMAEANMERIKINEMQADVFNALLHFAYTDQLVLYESSDDDISESSDDEGDSETPSVELLQGLFVAANRYALDKLTLLCEEQLSKRLSVDTVATTLILADQHSRTSLKIKCLDFASIPENFLIVALTEGYLQIMQGYPTLFAELSEKVRGSSSFVYKSAKKQKSC